MTSTVVRGKKADAQVVPKPWRACNSPHPSNPTAAENGPRRNPPTSGVERPAHQRRPAAASGFCGAGPGELSALPAGTRSRRAEGSGAEPGREESASWRRKPWCCRWLPALPGHAHPSSACGAYQCPAESSGLLPLSPLRGREVGPCASPQ